MTPEEQQIEKDRYRFSAYHWVDTSKSVSNNPKDDCYTVPINIEYARSQPVWWGKKAISTQPL